MIRCVIFDCDGTLVDSEYLCNLGLEIMLRDYGITASATDLMQRFRGGKLATILQTLEAEYEVSLQRDFIPTYRALVEQLFEQQLKPCAGVSEALSALTLPICVASSGPPEKIEKSLALSGLRDFFNDRIFSSYVVGSWKPDPGIFLYAAREMGFEPRHCAVVEDSPVGIAAAEAAGMHTILYDPEGIHTSVQCQHRIRHMSELINTLGEVHSRIEQ